MGEPRRIRDGRDSRDSRCRRRRTSPSTASRGADGGRVTSRARTGHGVGLFVLPRRVGQAKESSRRRSRTIALSVPAAPSADRFRTRRISFLRTKEQRTEPILHRERARLCRSIRDVQERAGAVDVHPARSKLGRGRASSSVRAEDDTGRFTAGGGNAFSASFDFGVPRKSAVVGPHVGHQPRTLNDAVSVAFAKYQVSPLQSRRLGAGRFHGALRTARRSFSTRRSPSAAAATADGARVAWEVRRLSYLMPRWGWRPPWKMG